MFETDEMPGSEYLFREFATIHNFSFLSKSQHHIEMEIRDIMMRKLADNLVRFKLEQKKSEFLTQYKLEVYVMTPEELSKVISECVQKYWKRFEIPGHG